MARYTHIHLLLITTLLLGGGATRLSAQSFKPSFLIGGGGGAIASSVIFNPTVPQKLHFGYEGGIILRYDVESYAGVWLEVNYSTHGWTERFDEHPDLAYERTTRYLTVPLMTHFMIGKGSFKVSIDAGPQFGYFLGESATSTFESGQEVQGVRTRQHDIPTQSKVAWGLGGGPGIEYHFPHFFVGLRASYYYGLGDIFYNTKSDYFNKSSEQVYGLKAYVLYHF